MTQETDEFNKNKFNKFDNLGDIGDLGDFGDFGDFDRLPLFQKLTPLEQYSLAQWDEAVQQCPVMTRYQALIQRKPTHFPQALRLFRHKAWLRAALGTYFNTEHDLFVTQLITQYWSRAADLMIQTACDYLVSKNVGAGKGQVSIFALGKLGAEELNLSSDVDLFYLIEDPENQPESNLASSSDMNLDNGLRFVRQLHHLLQENTELGFCFRIDNDIRPGGRLGPLIFTLNQLQDYYGLHAQTWERLALVRLRPIWGSVKITAEAQEIIKKFIYRRHLDFTLTEELKILRHQVHEISRPKRLYPESFHLKLGVGGIRDIELFVHSLQVIYGGRNTALRTHNTHLAFEKLAVKGMPPYELVFLKETYWFLRSLEHRLQIIQDQQNHFLSFSSSWLSEDIIAKLKERCGRVDHIVSSLLGSHQETDSPLLSAMEDQKTWLINLGFSERVVAEIWPKLLHPTTPHVKAMSGAESNSTRRQFLRDYISIACELNLDLDLSLRQLYDFVRGVGARSQFFNLFLHEPRLTRDLASMFSISPYLGGLLAARPELLDSYLLRLQDPYPDDLPTLLEELADRRLLTNMLSIHQFVVDADLNKLTHSLSQSADEISLVLLRALQQNNGATDIMILALGKWGGCELGLNSDLDFMFVTRGDPRERDYKIARRFVSRLTEQHRGGSIYNIDLRLRPSGNSGPIIVSQQSLYRYIHQEASAWERQAYLRSRPLSKMDFSPATQAHRRGVSAKELEDLKSIRLQLHEQHNPAHPEDSAHSLNLKYVKGGLMDIEFAAQIAILQSQCRLPRIFSTEKMLEKLAGNSPHHEILLRELQSIYQFLRRVEQLHRICSHGSGSTLLETSGDKLAKLLQSSFKIHKNLPRLTGLKSAILHPNFSWPQLRNELEVLLDESRKRLRLLDPCSV